MFNDDVNMDEINAAQIDLEYEISVLNFKEKTEINMDYMEDVSISDIIFFGNSGEITIKIYKVLPSAVVLEFNPVSENFKLNEMFFKIPMGHKYENKDNLLILNQGEYIDLEKRDNINEMHGKEDTLAKTFKIGFKKMTLGQITEI